MKLLFSKTIFALLVGLTFALGRHLISDSWVSTATAQAPTEGSSSLSEEEMMMQKKKMMMEANAQKGSEGGKEFCVTDDNLGAGGFDLITYFEGSEGPKAGNEKFAHQVEGLTYHFVSQENLERFKKSPEEYLPQFGGWCAMSLALGRFLCPDHDNYKVEDGKLYIFETTGFTNGKILWNKNPDQNRKKANSEYKKAISGLEK